jgi:GNAT superfamily N-acetyltransferase
VSSTASSSLRIEKLVRQHAVDGFDCGREQINRYLARYAWVNQQASAAQTYVGLAVDEVVGFYTLVVGEVTYDAAPQRLTKGLARHPVPIMLLARLGVSVEWQGRRVGSGLLKDAVLRTLAAAEIAGIRALAVHAKDDDAAAFYRHFNFVESPTDPFHLFMLIKDLKQV